MRLVKIPVKRPYLKMVVWPVNQMTRLSSLTTWSLTLRTPRSRQEKTSTLSPRARWIPRATRTNGFRRQSKLRGQQTQEGIAFGKVLLPPAQTCPREAKTAAPPLATSIPFGQVRLLLQRNQPPPRSTRPNPRRRITTLS